MLDRSASRRCLIAGGIMAAAALALADQAQAAQFSPPSARQAQRIVANAYEGRLRPFYPRAGIRTRCKGRRHLLCSVHVYRRSEHLAWFMTRVDLENGRVHTALSPNLEGVISIPQRTLMFRSRPWSSS